MFNRIDMGWWSPISSIVSERDGFHQKEGNWLVVWSIFFSIYCFFSQLTNMFQRGWNHQRGNVREPCDLSWDVVNDHVAAHCSMKGKTNNIRWRWSRAYMRNSKETWGIQLKKKCEIYRLNWAKCDPDELNKIPCRKDVKLIWIDPLPKWTSPNHG